MAEGTRCSGVYCLSKLPIGQAELFQCCILELVHTFPSIPGWFAQYEIESMGERFAATYHARAPFDPDMLRVKGIYDQ
jgi:hypothetical protein